MSTLEFPKTLNAKENQNFPQAMNCVHAKDYFHAVEIQPDNLYIKITNWVIMDERGNIDSISSTWTFKCKWLPYGDVNMLLKRFLFKSIDIIKR